MTVVSLALNVFARLPATEKDFFYRIRTESMLVSTCYLLGNGNLHTEVSTNELGDTQGPLLQVSRVLNTFVLILRN